jgi:hypothetical protein
MASLKQGLCLSALVPHGERRIGNLTLKLEKEDGKENVVMGGS